MKAGRFKVWLVVTVLLTLVLVGGAMAQEPQPFISPPPGGEYPPLPDVDVGGVEDYVASLGIGAVVMVVIEILKRLQVIPDGQGGRWATVANIVIFAGLVVGGIFGVDFTGDTAQSIIDILQRVGQAILLIISSPIFFKILRSTEILPKRE